MGNILLRNIFKNNGVYYPNIPFIPTNPNSDKVLNATTPTVTQSTNYYPFGLAITTTGTSKNKYLYNGKEIQPSNGYYDYGARMYDASVGRWFVVDALGEKHKQLSAYSYTNNNPIKYIDPDGNDWFWYSKDGKSDPTWNWQEGKEYKTGVKDNKGNEVVLKGQEAVVEFKGHKDEKLGEGENVFGKGAKLADVTVYGPGGKDDIKQYKGFSMTSDYKSFGAIADGEYNVNYDEKGKSGKLESHWAVNNRDYVSTIDGNRYGGKSNNNMKNGIFIHSSNKDGKAGTYLNKLKGYLEGISTGCLLIVPSGHGQNGFGEFNKQLKGVKNFLLQLKRD